jgi:hypothetical protein
MRPRVAVLHHPGSFFPLDLVREIGSLAELVWVVDESSSGDVVARRLLPRLGTVVDISGMDLDAAETALRDERIEGIVTFVDDHLLKTAVLAKRLGLVNHSPEIAAVLVDKRRQREVLADAGVKGPVFWTIAAGADADAIAAVAKCVQYPAVLKPSEGSGSRGIRLVGSPVELQTTIAAYDGEVGFIVEEYLHDDPSRSSAFASYLSVETVMSHGKRSHVVLTGRFPLAESFRETGNFVPAVLSSELQRLVLALVDEAIVALGISDAVIHTEIKLTPEGPRLIEVNGRLGGRPPFVLESVSDVNLFRCAIQVALGVPVVFEQLVACREVGYWFMIQPPVTAAGLVAVDGLDVVADMDAVDSVTLGRNPGDSVDWREGTASRIVTVQGRVADLETLASTIDAIERTVSIVYEPAV